MSERENGGPAFPVDANTPIDDPMAARWCGMTLRDYFAAKVLPSVYVDYVETARKLGFDEGWMMGVAKDAYTMADAMLEARK